MMVDKKTIAIVGSVAAVGLGVALLLTQKKTTAATTQQQSNASAAITTINNELNDMISKIDSLLSSTSTTQQQTVASTSTSTPSTTNTTQQQTATSTSGSGYIVVTPTTIDKTPNTSQVITITGFNFVPNSRGYVFAGTANTGGIELSGFTADSTGNFTIQLQNVATPTSASTLNNAIINFTTTMPITAYSYADGYSNTVVVELV